MRTGRKVDVAWAVIAILLVCVAMAFMSGCKKTPLEVGQVWEWKFNDNPFKDNVMAKRKILALRDGYVQYEMVDDSELGWISSMKERVFRAGNPKLIEHAIFIDATNALPGSLNIVECDKYVFPDDSQGIRIYPGHDDEIPEPDIHPQWGKGDLSPEHIKFFGESNGSRLDYIQNQTIGRHSEIIKEMAKRILILEGADPNDVRLERTG